MILVYQYHLDIGIKDSLMYNFIGMSFQLQPVLHHGVVCDKALFNRRQQFSCHFVGSLKDIIYRLPGRLLTGGSVESH